MEILIEFDDEKLRIDPSIISVALSDYISNNKKISFVDAMKMLRDANLNVTEI